MEHASDSTTWTYTTRGFRSLLSPSPDGPNATSTGLPRAPCWARLAAVMGFFVRVAAVCDRASRDASDLSDAARRAGLTATAGTARSVADALALLAFDATKAGAGIGYARVAETAGAASRALRQVAWDFEHVDKELEKAAHSASAELGRLAQDAMSQTQPIEE